MSTQHMSTQIEPAETMTQRPHTLVPSDRVEGTKVCRSDGKKIGLIKRLMIDKVSGGVAYAILSFGGLLGMGEKHLPVPWARMKYSTFLEAYELDLTDDELAKAPSYAADKDFDWGDRSDEIRIHTYYGSRPYWGAF